MTGTRARRALAKRSSWRKRTNASNERTQPRKPDGFLIQHLVEDIPARQGFPLAGLRPDLDDPVETNPRRARGLWRACTPQPIRDTAPELLLNRDALRAPQS